MVERIGAARTWRSGWQATLLVVVLIGVIAAGYWAFADVETPRDAYPALMTALAVAEILFLVAALACVLIAVWDRLRQTGPESEQEISLQAFSDVRMGLARPLIANLAVSFLILQSGLIVLPDFLTLVAQQAWLKVGIATPLVLLMAYAPFWQYPALFRNWRARGAPA